MTWMLRSLSGVALALMIAVTSLQMAVAHGQPSVAGHMVICKGLTVTTISIDADGNPVTDTGICPDYALSLFAMVQDKGLAEIPARIWIALAVDVIHIPSVGRTPVSFRARGPPWQV